MSRLTVITLALAAIFIAAALRRHDNKPISVEVEPLARRAIAPSSSARPSMPVASAPTFEPDFLNLLAPFETSDDTDPFLHEKRATAFQERIDQLSAAETSAALAAAESIHSANPTEASADLRDRLLQRWRELTSSANSDNPEPLSNAEMITALADSDPIAAATLALEQFASDQQQTNTIIGIVQRFAAKDPAVARAWVAQFPEGELRNRALSQLNRANALPREPDSPAAQ